MRIRDPQILEKAWKVFDEAKKKEQMKKDSEGGDNSKNTKEGKKRKTSDEKENDSAEKNGDDASGDLEEPKKKKKKKNKHQEEEENGQEKACKEVNGTALEETVNGSTITAECPSPFKWKTAITRCLQTAPEKGLKINKLKKMVFGEYYAVHGADGHVKSETELNSLLNKKLSNRTDKYVVVKDRVKLRSATE